MANNAHRPGSRASASFSVEEVSWLSQLFTTLLRGGDISVLVEHMHFRTLVMKVQRMQKSIEEQKRKADLKHFPTIEKSIEEADLSGKPET